MRTNGLRELVAQRYSDDICKRRDELWEVAKAQWIAKQKAAEPSASEPPTADPSAVEKAPTRSGCWQNALTQIIAELPPDTRAALEKEAEELRSKKRGLEDWLK